MSTLFSHPASVAKVVAAAAVAAAGTRRGRIAIAALAGLVTSALVVRRLSRAAERRHPPSGSFIEVDGVRLHYREQGQGEPLVLLHGNGSLAEDFEISGLVQRAAARYRVIVFDRPGYGYSERPAGRLWGPQAQAELLLQALAALDVQRPIVLGHSWGSQVALQMGLLQPEALRSLVLMSGYYFPTPRLDVPVLATPAIPLLGTLLRHTVSPLLSRLLWPAMTRRMFAPGSVTPAFRARFPRGLALRPGALQASAAESAMMIPAAALSRGRHRELQVPSVLVAGLDDRHVNSRCQSARLHEELPLSRLHLAPGAGHMVHHVATDEVLAAIDEAAALAARPASQREGSAPRGLQAASAS
ncbi:alpha/beta hydrolase [Aquabacterium sp. A7-Y]|uniref:alpha/beta fold hydrolase n=1 Tax=Aquabacterium sp. A7-Y TaxID=1349605 RepID=UPI00223CD58F|nr:alpha/beta hydrolase [Aquabacterium sp. A7-Y]MCW7540361.1 alpha/beta hydrolase [Aquabacterium sp. A7-Y]